MSAETGGLGGARRAAALALLFFALQIPDLSDVTRYHGDERFYTDAAIGMVQTGDLLTPRYPDGRVRSEKPLLSYLVLVGSYELFGISLVASRLPFLLAGALLVFLTWRAGRSLLGDDESALLAAAIVASCPDILLLSTRSTPDILLCLFLMLGFSGFAALVRGEGDRRPAAAQAWLGAGLATAAKGGLGVLLMVYAGASAAVGRQRAAALRRLVDPVFTPVGLLLGIAGFGVFLLLHGNEVVARSVDDQVAGRVATASSYVWQLLRYATIFIEHLAPWVVLVGLGTLRDPTSFGELRRRNRFLLGFALGWVALLVLTFAAGDVVRGRYLAPGYPVLALVLAAALTELARRNRAMPLLRRIVFILLLVSAIAGGLVAAGGARIGAGLVIGGLCVAGVAAAGAAFSRRGSLASPFLWLAITALVVQTLAESAMRASFTRSPVPTIAARLLSEDLVGARVAQVGESAHLASKLRLATGGRVPIDGYQRQFSTPDWSRYDVVVADTRPPESAFPEGFRVERCGETWGDTWSFDEVLAVVRADDPATLLARRSEPSWLAIRERDSWPGRGEPVPAESGSE